MEVVTELYKIPNLSLALGFFDGVHLGHQAVISAAVDYACKNNCKSALATFKSHPSEILYNKGFKYIYSKEKKYELISELKIDYVIELDFEKIRSMSAKEYLENILINYFSPKAIFSGFNHTFGLNKSGDANFLEQNKYKYGYEYFSVPQKMLLGEIVSSTIVRKSIEDGDFNIANNMLNRNFSISGKVIEGKKLGRTIGFPTINIVYPENIVPPAFGVYCVNVILPEGDKYKGIANFGLRPTVSNKKEPLLEVYILDFDGDLYYKMVEIEFVNFIRYEKKFDSIENLQKQISVDIESVT